jgi:hypothetical protein
VNSLLAVVEHALDEAKELEAGAERKTAEARADKERAAALREIYAIATKFEGPGPVSPPTRTEGETR